MSEYAQNFINHLLKLSEQDRGALAALRRSLAFSPGAYPPAYPYVERFVAADWYAQDGRRLALYATAGLFACHPKHEAQSFASALSNSMRKRDSASIEQRFVALLGADANNIADYLRQAIGLLAADGIGLNYVRLLHDLQKWMNPFRPPDQLRQDWARDFYRELSLSSTSQSK